MEISRRGFMAMAAALLAAETVEQVIPNVARVYSFPSRIVLADEFSIAGLPLWTDPAASMNRIDCISRDYILPRLADQVFTKSPLFERFMRGGRDGTQYKQEVGGRDTIRVPLRIDA